MHRAYSKEGLVCVSVNTDEPSEKETALKFLKQHHATFANFLIDETHDVWQKSLDSETPPAVLVIGRDGKRVKNFGDAEFTYDDVKKMVLSALKNKSN